MRYEALFQTNSYPFAHGLRFEITFSNIKREASFREGLLFEMGFFSRLSPLGLFSRFYAGGDTPI